MASTRGLYAERTDPQGRTVWRLKGQVGGTRFSTTFHGTKREAVAELDRLRRDARTGALDGDHTTSVAKFLDAYVAHRVGTGKVREGQTARTYRGYIANRITPIIGKVRVADVRASDAQRVLDTASADGCSASTVRQLRAILHGAFKWGVRTRVVPFNPVDGSEAPQVQPPKLSVPTGEQVAAILAACEPEARTALALSAATGLRRGEVCALRWEDVHLDDALPFLAVTATLQRVAGELTLTPPKSARGVREVLLPPSLVPMLRRHRRDQTERRMLAGPDWIDTGHVIDRGDGRPLDPDAFGAAFRQAARRAKVRCRLHDLRHAFATLQDAAGVDASTISRTLGHATTSFTERVYVHPDRTKAAPLAAATEAALGSVLGTL